MNENYKAIRKALKEEIEKQKQEKERINGLLRECNDKMHACQDLLEVIALNEIMSTPRTEIWKVVQYSHDDDEGGYYYPNTLDLVESELEIRCWKYVLNQREVLYKALGLKNGVFQIEEELNIVMPDNGEFEVEIEVEWDGKGGARLLGVVDNGIHD